MKEFLERAWNDIKQRKNLELYLVFSTIIAIFLADIFGVNTTNTLVEITLATLAVLLYGTIDMRHANEKHEQELSNISQAITTIPSTDSDFLNNTWEPSLKENMEQTSELWLVGVSLITTVKTNYTLIEKKLAQGHLVKVLVVHPDGVGLEIAVSRNYGRKDINQKRHDIYRTLNDLCELKRNSLGHLEIRTIEYPLAYGAIVINPQSSINGRLYIENYGYRVRSEAFPIFSLCPMHGEWYEFYYQELLLLWDSARDWNCTE